MTITLFTRLLLVLVYMIGKFYCFPMFRVCNVHASSCKAILPLFMEAVWPSNQRAICEIHRMLINVLFNIFEILFTKIQVDVAREKC